MRLSSNYEMCAICSFRLFLDDEGIVERSVPMCTCAKVEKCAKIKLKIDNPIDKTLWLLIPCMEHSSEWPICRGKHACLQGISKCKLYTDNVIYARKIHCNSFRQFSLEFCYLFFFFFEMGRSFIQLCMLSRYAERLLHM